MKKRGDKRGRVDRSKRKQPRKKPKKKKFKPSLDLPFDPKQFPNFPRVIYLARNKEIMMKITIIGYLHRLVLLKKSHEDNFWIVKDPRKEFRKKPSKRGRILHEDEVPNIIQRIHIYANHNCVAEVDFRGRLEVIESDYTNWTFHVEEKFGSIQPRS